MDHDEPPWVEEVRHFWFEELGESCWFLKNDELDARIRARFDSLHARLATAGAREISSSREVLAAVIVLDQFSRNMFRDTQRAFATDPVARELARQALSRGLDRSMSAAERLFLYLPFEHSEDRADQALAVRLVSELGNVEWTRFAKAHQEIVERFGRFPHRNAILGRVSTPEELALLEKPMSSF